MLYTLLFFSSKCSLFHNANLFGSCITHILYTECAKIKKNNSGAKRLMNQRLQVSQTSKGPGSEIFTDVAYTLFPAGGGQDGQSAQQEATDELKSEPCTEEKPASQVSDRPNRQEGLVTLPASVKLAHRAKQILIGRLEVPKYKSETQASCPAKAFSSPEVFHA